MTQTLARGKKRPPLPIRAAALEGRAVPVERDLVESRRTKTGRTVIHHTSARKRLYRSTDMDILTALDRNADYSKTQLQFIFGAWVLSGLLEKKKKISLADGDVAEEDYDK